MHVTATTNAFTLRQAGPDDTPALLDVFQRSVHEVSASHYTQAQRNAWAPLQPDLDRWQSRFVELTTVLAEREGKVAGFVGYRLDGYIDMLFSAPGFTRKGVASQLFSAALSGLKARGVRELTTHASLLAQPFFLRHGFECVKHEVVERNGETLQRALMRRVL